MPTFLLYCSFWHSALAEVVVRTNFEFIALFCRGQNYKFCVYLRPSLGRGLNTLCCSMLTSQCAQNKGKNSARINVYGWMIDNTSKSKFLKFFLYSSGISLRPLPYEKMSKLPLASSEWKILPPDATEIQDTKSISILDTVRK